MPALVAGIHVFSCEKQGVDGRDKPGHDRGINPPLRPAAFGRFIGTSCPARDHWRVIC
jgi:hypothetical protein